MTCSLPLYPGDSFLPGDERMVKRLLAACPMGCRRRVRSIAEIVGPDRQIQRRSRATFRSAGPAIQPAPRFDPCPDGMGCGVEGEGKIVPRQVSGLSGP
jgi:hypothetical protein